MTQKSFWKSEIKITYRLFAVGLILLFIISGLGSGIFINYVFPHLAGIGFLRFINPRFPVVVNRTEQLLINDSVDSRQIYDRLKTITVTVVSYPFGQDITTANPSLGTGLIVTSDGYIFSTKSSVVDLKNNLQIITPDGTVHPATAAAFDPRSELAVLKIAAENLPVAQFSFADSLIVGDKLGVVGSFLSPKSAPYQNLQLISVSASVQNFNKLLSTRRVSEYLAIDQKLPRDYNGAGLSTRDGRVVGLVSADGVLTGGYLQNTLNLYLKNRNLVRADMGFNYKTVTGPISAILKLPADQGVLVAGSSGTQAIFAGSPAAAAGLREGDFIYKINDRTISTELSLEEILNSREAGTKADVFIYRNGQPLTLVFDLQPQY